MAALRPGSWRRRGITIPAYVILLALLLGLAPLLLPLTALTDLLRRSRGAATRCLLFGLLYLLCEVLGVLTALAIWLASGVWAGRNRERFLDWNYGLQRLWATVLWRGACRVFRLTLEVEGLDPPPSAPFLFISRHASLPDVLLASALFIVPHGLRVRHVMKQELLWDPCLNIVGQRLPNVFVDRHSRESAPEVAQVAELGRGLASGEGVMIYPEGTRFTAAKRARIVAKLERSDEAAALERARGLRHVLPPRLGGTLALLESARGAEVLLCAHVGFEAAAHMTDLLSGRLVGQRLRVRLWRVAPEEIPTTPDAQARWLFDWWSRIDAWVGARLMADGWISRERSRP